MYIQTFAAIPNLSDNVIDMLTDAAIQTKDEEFIYNFAQNISKASRKKLAKTIVDIGSVLYIYLFARDVKGVPVGVIKDLADAVMRKKHPEYIYLFAENIPNAPICELACALVETKYNDTYIYINEFAKNIPNAPIQILVNAVKKSGSMNWIYNFAKEVPNAPIYELAQAFIAIKPEEHVRYDYYRLIYWFALIPGAPVEMLADALIAIPNIWEKANLIYWFAKETPGAPIGKLGRAILATKNEVEIRNFARDILGITNINSIEEWKRLALV